MLTINWRTDPQLFDSKPVTKTSWLNANELIATGRKKGLFLGDNRLLNLFPILVRRSDFVRRTNRDRILARFPYLGLTQKERTIVQENILLIAEKARDYFYRSYNQKILAWKQLLDNYLERGFVPLPLIRCMEKFQKIMLSRERQFESARGDPFTMPVKLTQELAYLSGVIQGDGNLQRYTLSVVDYSLDHIQQLRQRFQRLFGQEGRIQYKTPNSPELLIANKWVVRFFSFLTGQPIDKPKYPSLQEPLIFHQEPFRSSYWGGVMDADGSYKGNSVTFTTTSKGYANNFFQFLKEKEIDGTIIEREDGTYQVYLPHKYLKQYKGIVVCYHPEKFQELAKLKIGTSREKKGFKGFKEEALINGYFNFRLMNGLHIVGLGAYVQCWRGKNTKKAYAKSVGIAPTTLAAIETNTNALAIETLEKALNREQRALMPFLASCLGSIRFRKGRTRPIKLAVQPNSQLRTIAQGLAFYKNIIRIERNEADLSKQLEEKFAVTIKGGKITHKVLRDYFKTFCKLTKKG
ncbi:MAG: hypothetical protein GF308_19170 [Candidatus Heimdallarchaeota archaeon]|nr:hypothetical protein [Candidatus Heimdallarchaeota archaeon]